MFEGNNFVKKIVERSNKFNDSFSCHLCKIVIIGYDQVKLHLAGRKHANNMLNENGNNNKEAQLVPELGNEQEFEENSGTSIPILIDDIPIPANLGPQKDCKGCMEKMNEEIEKICRYDHFQSCINYNFKDKRFLLEAMTHGTSTGNKLTDDYQKLEFLGDFVLNFLVSRHLEVETRNCNVSPGDLSQRRSTLISNNVLAWMAVRSDFHSFLRISCPFAKTEIFRFVPSIKKMEKHLDEYQSDNKKEKQDIVTATCQSAPKVLADIFESVAGAIYRDSGDQIDVVWEIYRPLMDKALEIY